MTFDDALEQYRTCRTQFREAKSTHARFVTAYNETKKPTDKAKARLEALAAELKPEIENPGAGLLDGEFEDYTKARSECAGLLRDLTQRKQQRDEAEQRLSMHASALKTAAARLLPELVKEVQSDLGQNLTEIAKDEATTAETASPAQPEERAVSDVTDVVDAVAASV